MPGTISLVRQGNNFGPFPTIQAAVDAAQNGDTVQLGAGTFREQVTVTDKTITINGSGQGQTTIESPDAAGLASNTSYRGNNVYSIVGVKQTTSATGLTIQNLTIDGRNQGTFNQGNGNNLDAIGGTNANITANGVAIQNVREITNGALNGSQRNTGIIVDNNDGMARSFALTNSTVSTFQKNGLTLNGTGLNVNVSGDTISGAGATTALSQNGVQVSRGATGTVANNSFSGLDYTPGSLATSNQANAILAYQAGPGLAVTNNTIVGAIDANGQGNPGEVGVAFQDVDGGSITGNTISNMMPSIVQFGTFNTAATLSGNTVRTSGDQNALQFYASSANATGYSVSGSAASDYFGGGGGNDTFIGLGGHDLFFGGAGNDVFYGNSTGADTNTESVSGSTAEYTGPQSDYTVTQNADGSFTVVNTGTQGEGRDTLHGIDTLVFDGGGGSIDLAAIPPPANGGGASGSPPNAITPGPDNVMGSSGSDTIAGQAGDDTINGGGGNDVILGNQGNDVIVDGDGNSTIAGGMNDDRITVGNGSNLLYGDEGADTIAAGNGNNTILGGTGNSALDANDGADSITAGSGNNLVLGNQGNDTI